MVGKRNDVGMFFSVKFNGEDSVFVSDALGNSAAKDFFFRHFIELVLQGTAPCVDSHAFIHFQSPPKNRLNATRYCKPFWLFYLSPKAMPFTLLAV